MLLISANGEGRVEFSEAIERHPDIGGLVATGTAIGIALSERYRPELVFLDLGLANVHAFDTIRVISALSTRAGTCSGWQLQFRTAGSLWRRLPSRASYSLQPGLWPG